MTNNAGAKLLSLMHHPRRKGGIEWEGRDNSAFAEGAKLELPRELKAASSVRHKKHKGMPSRDGMKGKRQQ